MIRPEIFLETAATTNSITAVQGFLPSLLSGVSCHQIEELDMLNVEVAGVMFLQVGGSCGVFPPLARFISRQRQIDQVRKGNENTWYRIESSRGGFIILY